ncbi:hypothetical protein [Brevibacillus reuszeri]|uniref:hypothetical protein n=1 Tax=Brevibacillus reuszeri TaxID=54915 RepID=UPI002897AFCC|nr:hypothetical protein [Brevibacillus reuszeri]
MTDEKLALVEQEKGYLLSCWLPSGTFRLAPLRNQINPYFTNLALLALIPLKEWEPIHSHVEWYFQHINSHGYVNDYRLEGQTEIDTGSADSEDSYHATLFSLVAEWIRATGNTSWLATRHAEFVLLLQGIASLQQKDGLTWAKHSYRVKYLMDNCEVMRGLEDAAYLFACLGDEQNAVEARIRANACKLGIMKMYSRIRKSYAMYDSTHPGWRKWYPDVTSQAFPILYEITEPMVAKMLYQRITSAFPHFDSFQTGDMYPWMAIGECARLMGDQERVTNMISMATEVYIHGPRLPYWLIHEAGRFLQLLLHPTTHVQEAPPRF